MSPVEKENCASEVGVFIFGLGDPPEPHFSGEMGHVPVRMRKIDCFEVKK
jgi:hypothetical protein